MPNFPQPYQMRDWNRVARDFDTLAFNFNRKGTHLPLIELTKGPNQNGDPVFALPSFVGWKTKGYEVMTCLGALNGASVAGIDKSKQGQHDWVSLSTHFFNDQEGINLYLNSPRDKTGNSFWYELFPNILFYQIYHHYPDTPGMNAQFKTVADQWHKACLGMGGKQQPWTVPNFNHTSYNFLTEKPFDNQLWTEGGSAAAIAWIEYMAYQKTGNNKYLTGAKWGLDYLEQIDKSPYYEILFPHGPYIAARMNAELGTNYDVPKLVHWCFDGNNKRGWGESVGKWGEVDCSGLAASVVGSHGGYAFAMNTFNKANSLVPLVRYDDRFARAIGKWMLNAANSSRFYYANGLPESHQTGADWAKENDPNYCIAYEGLKRYQSTLGRIQKDHKTISGKVSSGSINDTLFTNKISQVLQESKSDTGYQLEHIWEVEIVDAQSHTLNMLAHTEGEKDQAHFTISYASSPKGPFTVAGTYKSTNPLALSVDLQLPGKRLYLKVSSNRPSASSPSSIAIDDVWIFSKGKNSPFACGDAKESNWAQTDFGLYGSAFVGIFGGIIKTTDVEGILQLDCLATDYFRNKAYPTFLYYNPHAEARSITITPATGSADATDIYDTVTNAFIVKNIKSTTQITIPADTAMVLVEVPTKGKLTYDQHKTLLNDVVIDYTRKKE